MLTLPATDPTPLATVIFLHGLSHANLSWLPRVRRLAQDLPNVKWILPQAEIGPITLHQGAEGPRWFDVYALPPGLHEDDTLTAQASRKRIHAILDDVIGEGMPPNKVLLVGFSQGSAMALLSALTFEHTLGGIGVLAGWLPHKLREAIIISRTAASPPLFWAHGTTDVEIPLENALDTMNWLHSSLHIEESGLTYQKYLGLAHAVNDDVLRDLGSWIANLL